MLKKNPIKNNLNTIKKHQESFHNLLKEQKEFFTVNKTVPKKAIDNFIKTYKKGEIGYKSKKSKKFTKFYNRYYFALTKSILATYRVFNYVGLNTYLSRAKQLYSTLKKHNFKKFEIMPINIIDIRKIKEHEYVIIEKVHPSLDYFNTKHYNYYKKNNLFIHVSMSDYPRLLKKSKLSKEKFDKKLADAYEEYKTLIGNLNIDSTSNNILILDYNPKTDKFLLGPIDFY